jgi:hypothetical protein
MIEPERTYRLCEIPGLIGRGATQRQLVALIQAFQYNGIAPRPAGTRWARRVYTPGLVLRLAIAWEAAHALDMGLAVGLAAARAAVAGGLLIGDHCAAPDRALVWIHPTTGWEPGPGLEAAGLRALAAGAGVLLNVSLIARGLAIRAHAGGWPPHAIEPDESPCRCWVEVTTAGTTVRAVLDDHASAACREADGAAVAWPCRGEKPLAVAARERWRRSLEAQP